METKALLFRLLGSPSWRAKHVQHWHTLLSTDYATLVRDILCAPACLTVYMHHLTILGKRLPLPRSSLPKRDAAHLDTLVANKQFTRIKTCINDEYEYAGLVDVDETAEVTDVWRRQLVRDVAWLVACLQEPKRMVSLIVAVQTIIQEPPVMARHGPFLITLHAALQRRCQLDQILVT